MIFICTFVYASQPPLPFFIPATVNQHKCSLLLGGCDALKYVKLRNALLQCSVKHCSLLLTIRLVCLSVSSYFFVGIIIIQILAQICVENPLGK